MKKFWPFNRSLSSNSVSPSTPIAPSINDISMSLSEAENWLVTPFAPLPEGEQGFIPPKSLDAFTYGTASPLYPTIFGGASIIFSQNAYCHLSGFDYENPNYFLTKCQNGEILAILKTCQFALLNNFSSVTFLTQSSFVYHFAKNIHFQNPPVLSFFLDTLAHYNAMGLETSFLKISDLIEDDESFEMAKELTTIAIDKHIDDLLSHV